MFQRIKTNLCLSEAATFKQTNKQTFTCWNIDYDSRKMTNKFEGEFTFRDTGNFNLNLVYKHNKCVSEKNINNFVHIGGLPFTKCI